jgi:hypothetical protein
VTPTALVTFIDTVSAANSTVVASLASIAANNATTSTITVTLKDFAGNGVAGKTVTLTPSGGTSTITTVSGTTSAGGVATFTVKDTTGEVITYTANDTTDGITVTQTAQVTFIDTVSAANSTVVASLVSIAANNATTSTITVTLKDFAGIGVAGKTVTLTPSGGTSTVTTVSGTTSASGVATFTVKDTKGEVVTYTATDTSDTVTVTQTAQVTFIDTVSAANSTVVASPVSIAANNATTSTITVTLKDFAGIGVAGKAVTLTPSGGTSTITTVSGTTSASGVATFTVKDTTAEVVTYTAKDTTDTITVTQTAQVTFIDTVSAANSTVVASLASIAANNATTSTITVTLKDFAGNGVAGKTVTLTPSGGTSTITTVSGTTSVGGVATFTVKDTTAEVVTYTAKDTTDTITVTQTAQVTFTDTVSAANSTVVASLASIAANNATTSTITVTLKDFAGIGVAGKTVTLTPSGGTSTITTVSGTTSVGGVATFTVKDTTGEVTTYTASDTTDGITVTQTAQVTFIDTVSAANSTAVASPATVTADNNATSTITVTLQDYAGNGVAGKTVTLTAGGGSSTITTVVGTTNASGQATFTVQDGTPEGPITYTATDTTDTITVTQTAQVTFTAATCYFDALSGTGTPNSYWSIGAKTGAFTPQLVANRLRLTDTGTTEATWATLNKIFPGAANKITVEFNHYAYGGTGADGIALILSDASIAPAAGAFGGSLGYAQKSNPGSDCTVTGGCVGFAGGWMGVAFDEFGGFQSATEGRVGGSAALVPESVSIRGSGSGMLGYRYIIGTSTLSPKVDGDGSASPPYRYRVTIDHTDGVHAWASVERDTTGGGAAYQTILGATGCVTTPTGSCVNIIDPGYSQNPVPASWRLSFTASNGVNTDTHEINSVQVCTVQNIVTPTLDHIEIDHNGQGCTGAGSPTTVTLKACANAACTALYLNPVTVNLTAVTGGTWTPTNPVTINGGSATVTLADTGARTVTLAATATGPTAANATQCYAGSTNTCSFTFATCFFDVVEVGKAAKTDIYTKLVSTNFNLDVVSVAGTQTATAVQIVDANSGGGCPTYTALSTSSTAVPATFNGSRTFAFNYGNAVANAKIRVTSAGGPSCSTDAFTIRPTSLTVTTNATNAATSGTPKFKAGSDAFTITATAVDPLNGNVKLTGYNVPAGSNPTAKLDFNQIFPGSGLTLGKFGSGGGFAPPSGGVSTATLTYSEVGNFTLGVTGTPNAVYDDGFTGVDSSNFDCDATTNPYSNTLNSNGMYGCNFGSASPPAPITLGRFTPDHFTTTTQQGCNTDGFTYSRQPFAVTVTAMNASSPLTATLNYFGSFANGVNLSDSSGAAGGFGSTGVISAQSFSAGVASVTPAFTFTKPATTNATISVRATDAVDTNVSSSGIVGTALIYSGRIRLSNAYGSELLALTIPAFIEYYASDTAGWQTINSPDKTCTGLSNYNFAFSTAVTGNNLTPCRTWLSVTQSQGTVTWLTPTITLAKPGAGFNGWTDITLNLDATPPGGTCTSVNAGTGFSSAATTAPYPWLQFNWRSTNIPPTDDPKARAVFGVRKSGPTIFQRELY